MQSQPCVFVIVIIIVIVIEGHQIGLVCRANPPGVSGRPPHSTNHVGNYLKDVKNFSEATLNTFIVDRTKSSIMIFGPSK